MWTRTAVTYVILFRVNLEQKLLTWTTIRPYEWWCFTDDIFAIWQHGPKCLNNFLQHVNTFHSSIKFTSETSKEQLPFLDTMVILDGGIIHTEMYTKSTDTHQFLSLESNHLKHCTTSISHRQSLRIQHICSRKDDLIKRTTVDLQFQTAANIPHFQILTTCSRRPLLNRTPLVATYHPRLSSLARTTKKHLPVLHASVSLNQTIPNTPLVALKQPKNLIHLLVLAKLNTSTLPADTGNTPCRRRRCKCCDEIVTTSSFTSYSTGRQYNIRANITCKSRNLVYLISCKKCGVQYVGETKNPLHIRMNRQRSEIRAKKLENSVAKHFSQLNHSAEDVEVRGIEKIHINNAQWRKQRESYWISELNTLAPYGLNLKE